MAEDKFIDIHVEGEEKIQAALRAQGIRQEANLRELVDDLADVASIALIAAVPRHNDYIMNHIDRDGAVFVPGGAGGGGEWKAIVGIKEGTSRHPIYVEFGTGIYGGRAPIFSRTYGLMPMEKGSPEVDYRGRVSRVKFRRMVRGQKGQHYFYLTWRVLNAVAEARILARKLF